jgi:hypothetical protein
MEDDQEFCETTATVLVDKIQSSLIFSNVLDGLRLKILNSS